MSTVISARSPLITSIVTITVTFCSCRQAKNIENICSFKQRYKLTVTDENSAFSSQLAAAWQGLAPIWHQFTAAGNVKGNFELRLMCLDFRVESELISSNTTSLEVLMK